jgi:hypothetical protein
LIEQTRPAASPISTDESPLTFRICDAPLVVEGLSAELRDRFAALMRPFAAPLDLVNPTVVPLHLGVATGNGDWEILRAGQVVAAYGDPDLLLTQLEWHAVTAALEATTTFAPIHGAALSRGSSVVLLLADSGAGKTTLTLGLMRRGWLPLSDDITLIDVETLAVRAFPRCFHVDEASWALAGDDSLVERPGAIHEYARPLRWADVGAQPTTVLVVERCETCPSRVRALTLAEAAAAIGNNSIRSRLAKAEVARVAVRLAIGARLGGRLNNGRLDDTLDLIEAVSQE